MIERERLEELIEQGATIWDNVHCQIKLINDSKHKINLLANALYVAEEFENCATTHTWWEDYTIGFYALYENEEDSKWAEEFGNIKRTERLELPTWEEFQNKDFVSFISKTGKEINMLNYFFDNEIYISDTWDISKRFNYSKDGYTLACRKCKKLFLGE